MAKVIIKVNVAYPGFFHETIEAQSANRRKQGERKFSSGIDCGMNNIVYVIIDWESTVSATQFWNSSEAKSQVAQWGSVSTPEIIILRESDSD